jgi:hypothetical protein
VLERLFAHTATTQWVLTLPPDAVTHMVGELVKLVDCPNEVARTAALRVLSNLAVAAPQLPPVLRAPCDEALVLLSLLCACLVLRCVLATPTDTGLDELVREPCHHLSTTGRCSDSTTVHTAS